MSNREKIGIGITTCNREYYFRQCFESIDLSVIDHLVIVNDGKPFNFNSPQDKVVFIQNESNLGVSKSKNKILNSLLASRCDHIFTIEDDCIITDNTVFQKYITTSKETGIRHFNFGPGSPWNRKQKDPTVIGDLARRQEATQDGDPNPKLIVEYKNGVSISLYEHIVAMLSYFDARVLNDVGVLNEEFYNAWEHVEHTLRIIKEGWYSPFWWFADITGSENYIKEAKDEKANTSLAKNEEQFMKQVRDGLQVFHRLHGVVPAQITAVTADKVLEVLKNILSKRS